MKGAWAVLVLATMAAGCGSETTSPDGVPRHATVVQAEQIVVVESWNSGYDAPQQLLITDAGAWAQAWQTVYRNQSEIPPLPAVNFSSDVVLLAAMGTRPTGGYSVRVTGVHALDGAFYVSVAERSPGATCGTFQAITAPVHAVRVPRSATRAHFNVTRQAVNC
jgi:hypothetical protein